MLTKRTAKNQITLPKAIASRFPGVDYFEVRAEGERIILEPLRRSDIAAVRSRLMSLRLTETDVDAAVRWARKRRR